RTEPTVISDVWRVFSARHPISIHGVPFRMRFEQRLFSPVHRPHPTMGLHSPVLGSLEMICTIAFIHNAPYSMGGQFFVPGSNFPEGFFGIGIGPHIKARPEERLFNAFRFGFSQSGSQQRSQPSCSTKS